MLRVGTIAAPIYNAHFTKEDKSPLNLTAFDFVPGMTKPPAKEQTQQDIESLLTKFFGKGPAN